MRKIYLIGSVDEEMYYKFTRRLDRLESESVAPISIELCSDGGIAHIGMAIATKMQACRCKLFVYAHGCVESAATAILAAGDKRVMADQCTVMVHDGKEKVNGDEAAITKALIQARRVEQQWADFFASVTGTPSKVWRDLSAATTYMTAQECLQLGLIDVIAKPFDKSLNKK